MTARAIGAAVADWIDRSVSRSERSSLAKAYFDPIFRDYDLEMRPFSWQNPPDPQLVRFFMFTKPN